MRSGVFWNCSAMNRIDNKQKQANVLVATESSKTDLTCALQSSATSSLEIEKRVQALLDERRIEAPLTLDMTMLQYKTSLQ